jgi:UDP-N-acetylmuramate: L-alanyl-gamma-D-glutamyl-meso-diaminopimelate ligase
VILTSVEFDHADIYKDLDDVKSAFIRLLKLTPTDGLLVWNGDDENIKSIISQTTCKNTPSYGVGSTVDWRLGDIRWGTDYSEFDIVYKGKKYDSIRSTLFGEYNLLNSLAVYITATSLGQKPEIVKKAFETFKGVKRRQEIIGRPSNITIIDDFAHHPTAVRVTLQALREKYPGRRLIAVFEPRSATSRRKIFQEAYGHAFQSANLVYIAAPYDQSRISADDRFSSDELVQDLKQGGVTAAVFREVDEGVAQVAQAARAGDVVAVLSNGGFGGFIPKLIEKIK